MNPSGAAAAAGGGARALMSIGEVLGQLRAEFPDVTISKLRFLEAEGLVTPQRTASGYRKYSWDDVSRLRYVLTAQRDHYLPLRVIREQLAQEAGEWGRPTLVAVGDDGDGEPFRAPAQAPPVEPADVRLSRAELAQRAGVDEAAVAEMEQHGLLAAGPGGWYDGDALVIAQVVTQLGEYGLQPRHLRAYRLGADREVGLFSQLVAPMVRQSDPAGRARAAELVREVGALSQRLHAALVRAGLRETLGR